MEKIEIDNNIKEQNEEKKLNKKGKKGKKFLKKQKRKEEEEERKRKELQKEKTEEEKDDYIEEEGKEGIKVKSFENSKEKEHDKNNEEKEKKEQEYEEIDKSSQNFIKDNDNEEDKKEEIYNEKKNKNDIIIDNQEEENEDNKLISIMIKKLTKARKGSICQELAFREGEYDYIIDKAYDVLKNEDSMLKISAPLYICGDIHGQYYDLLRVFEILDFPPKSNFLFLGDYVDRGKQSLECLLLLLCLKIKYPTKIFLLRGNHESEALNKIYGFYDECKRRISIKCFKKITNLFNILPITALINDNILCMHGGLSKELNNLEQLNKILRPTEIPDDGLLCDLVWSDPSDELNEEFGENERNISVTFSKKVVEEFTNINGLDLICRAHQVVEEGFQFFAGMKLITVFTAPNYAGEFDNNGGILEVDKDLLCRIHILRPNIERGGKRKRITELVN